MDFVGDRTNLSREAGAVRLIAIVAFSLIVITLVVLLFFFNGFSTPSQQLFFLSVGHLIVAPVAGYAALRLGWAILAALILAIVQTVLDSVELAVRIFGLPFTLLEFIFIVLTAAFVVLDVLYLGSLWRLYSTDRAQNRPEEDPLLRSLAILRQEKNTARVAGLFGLVASVILFSLLFVFLSFDDSIAALTLYSIGHLILGPYAILIAPLGTFAMAGLFALAIVQIILDTIEFILRATSFESSIFSVLTLASVFTVMLIMVNFCFILVDVMYLLSSFGYIYERLFGPDHLATDAEAPKTKVAPVTASSSTLDHIRIKKES